MEDHLTKPKSFGAVLDQTFRISKNNFSTFFMIMLIVVGPIVLLDALISLLAGSSFFRDVAGGGSFFEQLSNTIDDSLYGTTSLAEDLGALLIGLATIVLYPIAQAAVIYAIEAIRNHEEFTAGSVIKEAFSRFWPIFASSLLFGVIVFGMVFVPVLVISAITAIGALVNPIAGVVIFIVLFLAIGSVIAYFLTRWSLYLPAVAFEPCAPGLGRSWNLTRKNFWRTFGLIVVIGAITIIISVVFDLLGTALLGYSVLYSIIINIVTIITTMFFSVGYALIYFDLKQRNDGDDLMEMIESYESPNE
ncbi:hypothetical protein [Paucisalibacillus sp. EB02]|uniref:hypothetical protein n=1 Tax=Paucisalibacillus sp. EB02 TaxID=1347087 RepID=UPI0004B6C5B3|nr:hypothetical protein [Paucisalibacillus sp. EB02]